MHGNRSELSHHTTHIAQEATVQRAGARKDHPSQEPRQFVQISNGQECKVGKDGYRSAQPALYQRPTQHQK
jgi:hypothetical protein